MNNCPIGYTAKIRQTSQSLLLLEKSGFQHFHTTFPQLFRLSFVQIAQVFFSTFLDFFRHLLSLKAVENSVETVQNLEKQRFLPQGFPKTLWKTLSRAFSKINFLCTFFCVLNKTINQGEIAQYFRPQTSINIPLSHPKICAKSFSSYLRGKREGRETL